MDLMGILQTANGLGTIVLIMVGSAWLKRFLKQYAGANAV